PDQIVSDSCEAMRIRKSQDQIPQHPEPHPQVLGHLLLQTSLSPKHWGWEPGFLGSVLSSVPPLPPQLYEDLQVENEKLKEQLQETQLKLTQIKLELERVTQVRGERRALERKAAELEEELKVSGSALSWMGPCG
uniref:Uncharacterized protein n=1 Tax=Chelonoidis abingdonii TaxID=106734 RepID=A0A8C0H5E1_CHEAB